MLPSNSWSLSADPSSFDRISLAKFWLHAPSDQIESLWSLRFGQITSDIVKSLTPETIFSEEEVELRNQIGSHFNQHGLSHELTPQLMVANFLFSPPGLLKINNANDYFPSWLFDVYIRLYESSANSLATDRLPLSQDSSQSESHSDKPLVNPEHIEFGKFPGSLEELSNNRLHLNRLLGLSNLYYIDPDDQDVAKELSEIRIDLANIILNCPEHQLEKFWNSDLGDRYWSLVRSGIQARDLTDKDLALKQLAVDSLDPNKNGGFGTPNSTNSFLVAMMYFIPGSMKVDEASTKMPKWIYPNYKAIYEAAL